MHFKSFSVLIPNWETQLKEERKKNQTQPTLPADGRRRCVVGSGRSLGRVDEFNFALASVLGGQPVSSSGCLFWTVTFVPLLSGDWLHVKGKNAMSLMEIQD